MKQRFFITVVLFCYALLWPGCKGSVKKKYLFEVMESEKTGLNFNNKLVPTSSFNMFKYMYFYNGAGVGAGDFNKDGLVDVFFSSNQGENKLFLNQGKLSFKDVTVAAGIPQDGGWSTGVSVVDVNGDGMLDIYVCRVGNYDVLKSRNQLLICGGIDKSGVPFFEDKAAEYRLDFSGFGTQAAFFDFDVDGDLDLYLMNHSLRFNGTFADRKTYFNTYDSLAGDRFYRNDAGVFENITVQSGINSSIIGYGLGIVVSDINLDGYPDLYIGNDFHENDYLYINQKDGTFKDELTTAMAHTSQFSMGVDAADINNDAWPDIISVDMLPEDPYILKRSLGEDEYNLFQYKTRAGYFTQYARNNLQLNNANGTFSETGRYSGVYATDWSWAPLWIDFDNDGLKDLFVSNGIPKRLNDMDYVSFVSNDELQEKIRADKIEDKDLALINKFPEIKLNNRFFRNTGSAKFADQDEYVSGNKPTYSNGSVYADFDNDGDLDILVSNINDPALLYQNKSNDSGKVNSVQFKLTGTKFNTKAIGAKVVVFEKTGTRFYEKYPVRGFQSSMEIPLHVGLKNTTADSIVLIWPDNTCEKIDWDGKTAIIVRAHRSDLPNFDYKLLRNTTRHSVEGKEIADSLGLIYYHTENPFVEFDREPLIPHMVSREGPALAVGDMNLDGLDDLFVGSSKGNKGAVFIQQSTGRFSKIAQPDLDSDSTYEQVDACWVDMNNDQYPDLVVASGGNEFYGKSEYLLPRVYLNNKESLLKPLEGAFDSIYVTQSCIKPFDFDNDGYIDLFIGGRAIPWEYGMIPRSYLLKNNGNGKFIDVTDSYSSTLGSFGIIKNAVWADINSDQRKDLIIVPEWGAITAFINEKGKWPSKQLSSGSGWWNFVLPADIDNDGDIDFIAGNLGLNNRFHASKEQPVKLYYGDFDGNDKKEQVVTYYLKNREIPLPNKEELQKQIPLIKKRFLYAEDFAKASLADIFSGEKLRDAQQLRADDFRHIVLTNEGNFKFTEKPLPWQTQLSPCNDAVAVNINNDSLPDFFVVGNFFDNNIQLGAYDACGSFFLVNKGSGVFEYQSVKDSPQRKQYKKVRVLNRQKTPLLVRAANNDRLSVIRLSNQ